MNLVSEIEDAANIIKNSAEQFHITEVGQLDQDFSNKIKISELLKEVILGLGNKQNRLISHKEKQDVVSQISTAIKNNMDNQEIDLKKLKRDDLEKLPLSENKIGEIKQLKKLYDDVNNGIKIDKNNISSELEDVIHLLVQNAEIDHIKQISDVKGLDPQFEIQKHNIDLQDNSIINVPVSGNLTQNQKDSIKRSSKSLIKNISSSGEINNNLLLEEVEKLEKIELNKLQDVQKQVEVTNKPIDNEKLINDLKLLKKDINKSARLIQVDNIKSNLGYEEIQDGSRKKQKDLEYDKFIEGITKLHQDYNIKDVVQEVIKDLVGNNQIDISSLTTDKQKKMGLDDDQIKEISKLKTIYQEVDQGQPLDSNLLKEQLENSTHITNKSTKKQKKNNLKNENQQQIKNANTLGDFAILISQDTDQQIPDKLKDQMLSKITDIIKDITKCSDINPEIVNKNQLESLGLTSNEVSEVLKLKNIFDELETKDKKIDNRLLAQQLKNVSQDIKQSSEYFRVNSDTYNEFDKTMNNIEKLKDVAQLVSKEENEQMKIENKDLIAKFIKKIIEDPEAHEEDLDELREIYQEITENNRIDNFGLLDKLDTAIINLKKSVVHNYLEKSRLEGADQSEIIMKNAEILKETQQILPLDSSLKTELNQELTENIIRNCTDVIKNLTEHSTIDPKNITEEQLNNIGVEKHKIREIKQIQDIVKEVETTKNVSMIRNSLKNIISDIQLDSQIMENKGNKINQNNYSKKMEEVENLKKIALDIIQDTDKPVTKEEKQDILRSLRKLIIDITNDHNIEPSKYIFDEKLGIKEAGDLYKLQEIYCNLEKNDKIDNILLGNEINKIVDDMKESAEDIKINYLKSEAANLNLEEVFEEKFKNTETLDQLIADIEKEQEKSLTFDQRNQIQKSCIEILKDIIKEDQVNWKNLTTQDLKILHYDPVAIKEVSDIQKIQYEVEGEKPIDNTNLIQGLKNLKQQNIKSLHNDIVSLQFEKANTYEQKIIEENLIRDLIVEIPTQNIILNEDQKDNVKNKLMQIFKAITSKYGTTEDIKEQNKEELKKIGQNHDNINEVIKIKEIFDEQENNENINTNQQIENLENLENDLKNSIIHIKVQNDMQNLNDDSYEKKILEAKTQRNIIQEIPSSNQKDITQQKKIEFSKSIADVIGGITGNFEVNPSDITEDNLEKLDLEDNQVQNVLELKAVYDNLKSEKHIDNQNLYATLKKIMTDIRECAEKSKIEQNILDYDSDDRIEHNANILRNILVEIPINKPITEDKKINIRNSIIGIMSDIINEDIDLSNKDPINLSENELRKAGVPQEKINKIIDLNKIHDNLGKVDVDQKALIQDIEKIEHKLKDEFLNEKISKSLVKNDDSINKQKIQEYVLFQRSDHKIVIEVTS